MADPSAYVDAICCAQKLKALQIEQAGIELGLNQAETVSLELAN